MGRAGWEDHGDGIWFSTYKSRSETWSLLVEQTADGFVESACHSTSDEYAVIGMAPTLKEAQRHLLASIRNRT